jgi:uncharacterized membrane protein
MMSQAATLVPRSVWAEDAEPVVDGGAAAADEFGDAAGFETAAVGETKENDDRPQNLGEWIARVHPMVVHMPLAWLLLTLLVDVLTFWRGLAYLERPGFLLLVLTVVSFIPAMTTGFLALQAGDESDTLATALLHRNLMIACAVCTVSALVVRITRRSPWTASTRTVYTGLIVAAATLVSVGAHQGGKLVYGADFLPF